MSNRIGHATPSASPRRCSGIPRHFAVVANSPRQCFYLGSLGSLRFRCYGLLHGLAVFSLVTVNTADPAILQPGVSRSSLISSVRGSRNRDLRHHASRRQPGAGRVVFRRRQAQHRRAARRLRRPLHRGRLARLESQGHRVLRRGQAPPFTHAQARRVRLDAPQGRPRRPTTNRCGCWSTPSTPVVTIFGKTWLLHVREVLQTTPEENLAMIEDTVRYLKQQGRFVVYDAEHAFDGYKDDPEYALATWQAAERGGADIVVLCDTNGGSVPRRDRATSRARRARRLGVPHRHPHARRHRPRRRQRAGGDRGRRHARAGHVQRLRRADRQLQPDDADSESRVQAEEALGARRVAAAAQGAVAVPRRDRQRPAESAAAVGRRRRVLAQGRHARERRAEAAAQLRAHRSGAGRQQPPGAHQRAGRAAATSS